MSPRACLLGLVFVSLATSALRGNAQTPLQRIAFGPCAKQDQPQPIWESIVAANPQLFLFIGDNIYGDSEDMAVLEQKWDLLGAQPQYQMLKQTCPVLATWDDHDYGANDAGAEYAKKRKSQQLFLGFFGIPPDSPPVSKKGSSTPTSLAHPARKYRSSCSMLATFAVHRRLVSNQANPVNDASKRQAITTNVG